MRIGLGVVLALALAGCVERKPATVAFSVEEAAFIKKTGTATITGHAFRTKPSGVVVNAAGQLVRLVPDDAEQVDRALDQGKGRAAALAVLQRREIGRRDAKALRHLREAHAPRLPQGPDTLAEGRHGPCSLRRRRRT